MLRDEGGLWLQLVKAKYLRGRPLLACDCREGSQFWRAIQDIKHLIRRGSRFEVGDGQGVLFWLDPWILGAPLSQEFPTLFAICVVPTMLVADAFWENRWNIPFRRTFNDAEAADFVRMRGSLP